MGRFRGFVWLLAGLTVASLAALIAFVTLNRAAIQRAGQTPLPEVPVVVAAHTVPVRTRLSGDDIELKNMPVNLVPEGAAQEREQVLGRLTLAELVPGEVILLPRLTDPNVIAPDGRQALLLAEGEVLFALPVSDLLSRANLLKPGDHIDLLFTIDMPAERQVSAAGAVVGNGATSTQGNEPATLNVLQNLVIAAVVTGASDDRTTPQTEGLLLTVSPQEALVLKYVKDIDGIVDVVVRAPGDSLPADVEPVDVDYLIRRYQIPTEIGR